METLTTDNRTGINSLDINKCWNRGQLIVWKTHLELSLCEMDLKQQLLVSKYKEEVDKGVLYRMDHLKKIKEVLLKHINYQLAVINL